MANYLTLDQVRGLVNPDVARECPECHRWFLTTEHVFPFCSTTCKNLHDDTTPWLCHDCGLYRAPHGTSHCGCQPGRQQVRCIGATAGRDAGSGGCGWAGTGADLIGQACPRCDGRVATAGSEESRRERARQDALAAISAPKSADPLPTPSEQTVRALDGQLGASVAIPAEMDVCCEDTIRFRSDVPRQGDVIPCCSCPNVLRYSVGGWYVVPFPPIAEADARNQAAKDALVPDLQARVAAAYPEAPPTRYCQTCPRVASWIGDTAGGLTVYLCPEGHVSSIRTGAA